MKIIDDFILPGRRNRPEIQIRGPEFITIHSTGNTLRGANARAHGSYLRGPAAEIPASWHFTVDCREVRQHLPLNEVGWHAGDGANGPGNRSSIGIEICENSDGDLNKAVENAMGLTVFLLKELHLPVAKIRQHYDWNRKNCPRIFRDRIWGSWQEFLKGVGDRMSEPKPAKKVPERVKEAIEYFKDKDCLGDPAYWEKEAAESEAIGWLFVVMQRIHQRDR